jgi:hypothetical protein
MLTETRHAPTKAPIPMETAALFPELLDAAALFAALLCTFPRAVTWGNPMDRHNLKQSHERD